MTSEPRIIANHADAQKAWERLNQENRLFEFREMRLAVISLLVNGPRHGYGIMKDLRERLGSQYHGSSGSVYPTLRKLEAEGLVTCETVDGRKQFTLTRAGKQLWRKSEQEWERISHRIEEGRISQRGIGDVPTLLQRMLRAAYGASAASVGQPLYERALRKLLADMSAQLETFEAVLKSEAK